MFSLIHYVIKLSINKHRYYIILFFFMIIIINLITIYTFYYNLKNKEQYFETLLNTQHNTIYIYIYLIYTFSYFRSMKQYNSDCLPSHFFDIRQLSL